MCRSVCGGGRGCDMCEVFVGVVVSVTCVSVCGGGHGCDYRGSRDIHQFSKTRDSPSVVSMVISRQTGLSSSGRRPSSECLSSTVTCLSSGMARLNCVHVYMYVHAW